MVSEIIWPMAKMIRSIADYLIVLSYFLVHKSHIEKNFKEHIERDFKEKEVTEFFVGSGEPN